VLHEVTMKAKSQNARREVATTEVAFHH